MSKGVYDRSHRIRSIRERFESKYEPIPWTGCWIWTAAVDNHGYGQLMVERGGKKRPIKAHRIAWELYRGPIPEGLCVLHNCPSGDNPLCCNPDHLFLGTKADNSQDMAEKGRSTRGAIPWVSFTPNAPLNPFKYSFKFRGAVYYGGNFDTAEAAHSAAATRREEVKAEYLRNRRISHASA